MGIVISIKAGESVGLTLFGYVKTVRAQQLLCAVEFNTITPDCLRESNLHNCSNQCYSWL